MKRLIMIELVGSSNGRDFEELELYVYPFKCRSIVIMVVDCAYKYAC
jgi:hypothetical protein